MILIPLFHCFSIRFVFFFMRTCNRYSKKMAWQKLRTPHWIIFCTKVWDFAFQKYRSKYHFEFFIPLFIDFGGIPPYKRSIEALKCSSSVQVLHEHWNYAFVLLVMKFAIIPILNHINYDFCYIRTQFSCIPIMLDRARK